MDGYEQKLTLDRPATYQIKVPGELEENLFEWPDKLRIVIESDPSGMPVTSLTGSFDQAALQGFLRWLYSMGLPLISVNCVEVS
jgi:hypothetical protein